MCCDFKKYICIRVEVQIMSTLLKRTSWPPFLTTHKFALNKFTLEWFLHNRVSRTSLLSQKVLHRSAANVPQLLMGAHSLGKS